MNQQKANSRSIFGAHLLELGRRNPKTIFLTADTMFSNMSEPFKNEFPDRFFDVGIAEQNMVSIAAGLAKEGFRPYISSFAVFVTLRSCEQVRTDICYQNLPVIIVGTHAGLTSMGGATHYAPEDIAVLRSLPNITILCPGDPNQLVKMLDATTDIKSPVYIRIGRGDESIVYYEDYEYKIGKAIDVKPGKDATIIACGVMVNEALIASKQLEQEGISVGVIDMHTIKPIDRDAVIKAAKTGVIVTAEDHYTIGGLGSVVAEVISESGIACKFSRVGIPQVFASYGTQFELYRYHNMDAQGIAEAIRSLC